MSASTMLRALSRVRTATVLQRRCVTATATQSDPVQQLFIEKIRDYAQKSKLAGGKLVDANADVQKALAEEIDKLNKQFGSTGEELGKFPTFKFTDAPLAAPGVVFQAKEVAEAKKAAKKEEDEDEAIEMM